MKNTYIGLFCLIGVLPGMANAELIVPLPSHLNNERCLENHNLPCHTEQEGPIQYRAEYEVNLENLKDSIGYKQGVALNLPVDWLVNLIIRSQNGYKFEFKSPLRAVTKYHVKTLPEKIPQNGWSVTVEKEISNFPPGTPIEYARYTAPEDHFVAGFTVKIEADLQLRKLPDTESYGAEVLFPDFKITSASNDIGTHWLSKSHPIKLNGRKCTFSFADEKKYMRYDFGKVRDEKGENLGAMNTTLKLSCTKQYDDPNRSASNVINDIQNFSITPTFQDASVNGIPLKLSAGDIDNGLYVEATRDLSDNTCGSNSAIKPKINQPLNLRVPNSGFMGDYKGSKEFGLRWKLCKKPGATPIPGPFKGGAQIQINYR